MSPCPGDSQQGVCFWSPIYVMMFVAIAAVQGSGCSYRYETFVKLWQWLEIEQSSQKIWNRSSPAADRPGPEPVTGLVRTVAMSLALYNKLLLQTALHTNYQFGSVRQHHRFQLLWTDPMTPSLSTRITDRDHAGHSGNQLWLCLLLGLGYEAVISCTHIGIMLLTSWSGSTLQWGMVWGLLCMSLLDVFINCFDSVYECPVAYLIFYHMLLIMLAWSYWQAIFTPVVTTPYQVTTDSVII